MFELTLIQFYLHKLYYYPEVICFCTFLQKAAIEVKINAWKCALKLSIKAKNTKPSIS